MANLLDRSDSRKNVFLSLSPICAEEIGKFPACFGLQMGLRAADTCYLEP